MDAISDTVTALSTAIKEINRAILQFRILNPDFDNMRGDATVIDRLYQAIIAGHKATCISVSFKILERDALRAYNWTSSER